MRTVAQDARYALRTLRQHGAFSSAAILTLALAIGATTAIFGVVDSVLIRPLPYRDSGRLVSVATWFPGFMNLEFVASREYVEWRRENHVFEGLAAYPHNPGSGYLTIGDEPVKISTSRASDNFFHTLGVMPVLGRGFLPEETRPGGLDVMVLTYHLWKRQFASDPQVLGRSVVFEGKPFTIVGVLPPDFQFPDPGQVDAFTPLPIPVTSDWRQMSTWNVIGRLKPGVSLIQARAEFERLFQIARRHDSAMYRKDVQLRVAPLQEHRVQAVRLMLWVLLASVTCVLLIACANVANLLMIRAVGRQTEWSIRAALGAGRWRLLRQMLTESLLLSLASGFLGVGLAIAAVHYLARFGPRSVPGIEMVSVDPRVLIFGILLAILTGLLFGVVPALGASRATLRLGTAPQPVGPGHRSLRAVLVVGELALSLVLLISAGLLIQSLWRLQNQNMGFQSENVLTADLSLRGVSVPALQDLLGQLQAVPGTLSVAFSEGLPPYGGGRYGTFSRLDRPLPEPWRRGDNVVVQRVTPDFFRALGIPLRRGRVFNETDHAEQNGAAIVNETLARRYFPGESPLGKQVDGLGGMHWKTIVGVVGDTKNLGLDRPVEAEIFEPLDMSSSDRSLNLVARTTIGPAGASEAFRAVFRQSAKGLPVTFRSLNQDLSQLVAGPRFNAVLFGTFAAIALLLAVVGIYGVLSYSVAQRTAEIGIRIALGARTPDIVKLIGIEAMALTMSGASVGLAGAWWATRLLANQLYGLQPKDARTFVLVTLIIVSTAGMAAWIPARRAAGVDPMVALRT